MLSIRCGRFPQNRVDMPKSNAIITSKPIFEWYVVRCGSKNGHQKDICLKEIRLRVQNMPIALNLIVNIPGRSL